MSSILFSQVAVDANQVLASWRFDSVTREWFIILSAIGLVTLLALGWAIFLRKRHRHRHSHHHRHRHSSEPTETQMAPTDAAAAPPEKRRHRRRHRHRHRPRNPTLAETGGLPPIRPEDTPPPQP